MAVNFPENTTFVKSPMVSMQWQANRFITQNGYFLHGAVVEYKHPETGNVTGVAFTAGGKAVVFSNPDGTNKTGRQVMTIVNKIAKENKDLVANGQFPTSFITDYEEAFAIYENGYRSDMFEPEYWTDDLTTEDIADIEARLADLSKFEETEDI